MARVITSDTKASLISTRDGYLIRPSIIKRHIKTSRKADSTRKVEKKSGSR